MRIEQESQIDFSILLVLLTFIKVELNYAVIRYYLFYLIDILKCWVELQLSSMHLIEMF